MASQGPGAALPPAQSTRALFPLGRGGEGEKRSQEGRPEAAESAETDRTRVPVLRERRSRRVSTPSAPFPGTAVL